MELPEGYICESLDGEKFIKMNGFWVKFDPNNEEIRAFMLKIREATQ